MSRFSTRGRRALNRYIIAAVALAGAALPIQSAVACRGDFLGAYNTAITPQDTRSSSGARLSSVAAIIQQDRANYHRFGRADGPDQYDDMFLSAESRALIPRWMSPVPRPLATAIRRGDAYINVQVYEGCIAVSAG